MARGDREGILGGFGRGNRDTDNDGRPGNPSEGRDYAINYDLHSATEYTNRPETATQLLVSQQALRDSANNNPRMRSAPQNLQQNAQFFPDVGPYAIPPENTWAAHAELVKDPAKGLAFNPSKFLFDGIVAQHFPQIMDPQYEGIRANLAVMRNDTMGLYLKDGSFKAGDEKYIPYIGGVAHALGELLADGAVPRRFFFPHIDAQVANVEGVGAREMYNRLLEMQVAPGKWNDFKVLLGNYDRSWNLPPLEATPYSDLNLSAPPPYHPLSEPSTRFRDAYLNERSSTLATPLKGW